MAEESEKDEIFTQPTTMMPEITDDMLNGQMMIHQMMRLHRRKKTFLRKEILIM